MVRVLHVLSDSLPAGAVEQLRTLCEDSSVDHHIVSLERNTQSRSRLNVRLPTVTYCGRTGNFDATFPLRFGKHLRRVNPDVVHCWGDDVFGRFFSLANRWLGGPPIVATTSNPAIRKGVKTPVSSSIESVDRNLHVELGLPTDTQIFAVIGDLGRNSRFEDAMWGYDLWAVIRPDVHVVIFGNGTDRPRLEEFTKRMSSGHAVHFLVDSHEATRVHLPQCVGAWHPGTRDCGMLLEAMAVGLPVIAADCHEARDMIVHGETGFIVPPGDPAEFARKANVLLSDLSQAECMGQAARQRAEQHFDVESMLREYRSLYERATTDAPAAA